MAPFDQRNHLRHVDLRVSIFASAGDSGAATGDFRHTRHRGVSAPASSPLVNGAAEPGSRDRQTVRDSESVWNDDVLNASSTDALLSAGGGGVSARYVRPAY